VLQEIADAGGSDPGHDSGCLLEPLDEGFGLIGQLVTLRYKKPKLISGGMLPS
jgi:hypothetical protein